MRHGKKFNHLGRKAPHRKAMLSNMAISLINEKRIFTTVAKAKELRKFVEPLITRAKTPSQHNTQTVYARLRNNKEAVKELFERVGPKVADRPGGYTRILRTGRRLGDNAEMCMIELVDYNESMLASNKPKTRRGKKKKTTEEVVSEEGSAEVVEAKTEE
jgi:large subunit ribosomal protein L17